MRSIQASWSILLHRTPALLALPRWKVIQPPPRPLKKKASRVS